MAGASLPGPLGIGANQPVVDQGTSAVIASPLPVPTGTGAPVPNPPTAPVAAPVATDAAIEALDLATTARAGAYALKAAHPRVSFTSGRRSKEDQARAMSGNVVVNRKWIEQTYADSPLRTKCQAWVDNHPDKKTAAEFAAGLVSVFNTVADADLGKLSKHLSGEAFDVQPVDKDAEEIKKTIRGLAGLSKFLDIEGGLVRWHAQF
jgi:hypothetical protein